MARSTRVDVVEHVDGERRIVGADLVERGDVGDPRRSTRGARSAVARATATRFASRSTPSTVTSGLISARYRSTIPCPHPRESTRPCRSWRSSRSIGPSGRRRAGPAGTLGRRDRRRRRSGARAWPRTVGVSSIAHPVIPENRLPFGRRGYRAAPRARQERTGALRERGERGSRVTIRGRAAAILLVALLMRLAAALWCSWSPRPAGAAHPALTGRGDRWWPDPAGSPRPPSRRSRCGSRRAAWPGPRRRSASPPRGWPRSSSRPRPPWRPGCRAASAPWSTGRRRR